MNQNATSPQRTCEATQSLNHTKNSSARFLAAWKKAVEIIGPNLFACGNIEACMSATNREQLRPDNQAIERYLGVCSVGQGVFIGAALSFFADDFDARLS